MASKPKKIKDIVIGDRRVVTKKVVEKRETVDYIELVYGDGSTDRFSKAEDPAIEIEE